MAVSTTTRNRPPTRLPLRGGRTTLGPRVPTFLVSPWIKRQDVIHSRFDHTSIGATILRRFAGLTPPPSISARLDAALDVRDALSLTAPRPRSRSPRSDFLPSARGVRSSDVRSAPWQADRRARRKRRLPLAALRPPTDRRRGAAVTPPDLDVLVPGIRES